MYSGVINRTFWCCRCQAGPLAECGGVCDIRGPCLRESTLAAVVTMVGSLMGPGLQLRWVRGDTALAQGSGQWALRK